MAFLLKAFVLIVISPIIVFTLYVYYCNWFVRACGSKHWED